MHERFVSPRAGVPQGGDAAAVQDCRHSAGGGELQFQGAVVVWRHRYGGIGRDEVGQQQLFARAQAVPRRPAGCRRTRETGLDGAGGGCAFQGEEPPDSQGSDREVFLRGVWHKVSMAIIRTHVGIVGAGPAGLMLAHLLHLQGIESVVLESHLRAYVESRVRAGVLEQGTVDMLRESGIGGRMEREGLQHHGVELRFGGEGHRIDFQDLVGKSIAVYAQQEVVKDLIAARIRYDAPVFFEVGLTRVSDFESRPRIHYVQDGREHEIACDFLAGCDGFHGICRPAVAAGQIKFYERQYPFAWLGILARVAPASDELIYTYHERGFSLMSMRSPEVSRLYLQCAVDEEIAKWPDERIWEELRTRMATRDGFVLKDGPIVHKGIT